jgi:4-alpha-glucanotransferase
MAKPWGISPITDYKPARTGSNGVPIDEVLGYARAWKWLADENVDRTKIWSLEQQETVEILLYEMIDKV